MNYERWIKTNDKWIKPSLDHIIAKSKGGGLLIDNLQFISWLENRAKIDIEQDGEVFIAGTDMDMINLAKKKIEDIVAEVELNAIYKGKVTRIVNFGAFVELLPGKEGLLHISKISTISCHIITHNILENTTVQENST